MTARTHTNRTTILRIGIGAALLFALLALLSGALSGRGSGSGSVAPSAAADSARQDGGITVLGELDEHVPESSGLALGSLHGDAFWTHNDRGGDARLHAVALDGTWRRGVTVTGVEAVDWEDLAAGPCPPRAGAERCLYVSDTGDNDGDRDRVAIVVVPEPAADDTAVAPVAEVTFTYDDGPTDVEALAVDGGGGAFLVSKGNDGTSRLYRLDAGAFDGDLDAVARRVVELPIEVAGSEHRITGAALSPDGRTLAVRSSAEVYLFEVGRWDRAPRVCPVGSRQPQGEAIDYLDDTHLLLTSEGEGSPILSLRCP